MSTTVKQDKEFASEIMDVVEISINNNALENAIGYINNNLNPSDVFDKKLIDWASGEDCETIFSKEQLQEWAESNGYVKQD